MRKESIIYKTLLPEILKILKKTSWNVKLVIKLQLKERRHRGASPKTGGPALPSRTPTKVNRRFPS